MNVLEYVLRVLQYVLCDHGCKRKKALLVKPGAVWLEQGAAAGATTIPAAAGAHRRDNNDMARDGGGAGPGGQAVVAERAVGVGRAVVEKCKSPCRLPKQQKLGDTPITKHLCPRSRNTINTLPTLAHLALVVWLWAITTNAQGVINLGTASTASGG